VQKCCADGSKCCNAAKACCGSHGKKAA
jgi:hypothetical protein